MPHGVTYGMFYFLSLCLFLVLSSRPIEAISPITVRGTKFYDNEGNQFFMKGVSYIAGDGNADPLVNTKQCRTDAALMKTAGINTVYVYTADSKQDHDGCMQAFADQGIYVWLQLGDFPRVTNAREQGPRWTLTVYAVWTEVLDAFAGYDNILAFGIGQETITDNATSTTVAPSLKAAARDLHAFRNRRGYRPIPLSYSAADVSSLRLLTAQYLTCGSDADASIDLLGLNIFLGCSEPTWLTLRTQLRDLPIPVVISEAGCRSSDSGERNFADVSLILSPDYQNVFSGVSVFEWAMQESKYGIVRYADAAHTGEPETLKQFETLASVFAAGSPAGTPSVSYTPSHAPPACPTLDAAKGWLVDANAALPTIEGLQVGTITVRTTVTNMGPPGGEMTGDAGLGQTGAASSGGGDGLSTGAVAGIAVGSVVGVLVLVTGVLMCFRRRRRAAVPERQLGQGDVGERPPSFIYPWDKAELPAQATAAVEMDGSSSSATTSTTGWKMPIHGARRDSPTVTELPDGKWRRTTQYELEDSYPAEKGDGTEAGPWKVSPLTPPSKYV